MQREPKLQMGSILQRQEKKREDLTPSTLKHEYYAVIKK